MGEMDEYKRHDHSGDDWIIMKDWDSEIGGMFDFYLFIYFF